MIAGDVAIVRAMQKSRKPIIAIILALSACSPPPPKPSLDEQFIEQVKNEVRRSLKDPDSAKFDDVEGYAAKHVVCGKVNAKNSFGGYAGSDNFSYYNDAFHLESENQKSYVIGSGRCIIANAETHIDSLNKGDWPEDQKKKMIATYRTNIENIRRDPIFNP